MTREEILALTAGRELDALVAVRVMGRFARDTEDELLRMARAGEFDERLADPTFGCHVGETTYIGPEFYSTDIAAAWQVVEELGLTAVPLRGDCWLAGKRSAEGNKYLRFMSETDTAILDFDLRPAAEAETAPLAICRAALLATLEK